ncbi:tripartite tricarboxylate transporter substrate binding protein [Variovorax rhizosphaerae]|uniref:Tripartite tricarboxylate transporter substrate binding protein n=1 Tax=Variovorax rhizosphaerae TaxID=1836200 RepID=A0ABU8WG13_9BURK
MNQPTRIHRRTLLQAAIGLGASLSLPAVVNAQGDAARGPLKIIVPLPAGGAADATVRAIVQAYEKQTRQVAIVDNRPGGVFQIAMQGLLAAPPDGQTLIHLNTGMVAAQVVQKRFDLTRQLAPLTLAGETSFMVVAAPDSPFKTLKEMIEYGRANPGKLSFATPGPGSGEHLKIAQLEKAAGFTGLAVTYKGGPDMIKAVVGGEVSFAIIPPVLAMQFAPKGQVKVLATLDGARVTPQFPDAPTMAELGIPMAPTRFWGGFAAHADTPAPIVQRLSQDLGAAVVAPSVVERMATMGLTMQASKPEEFRKVILGDVAWMTEAAKGLKFE